MSAGSRIFLGIALVSLTVSIPPLSRDAAAQGLQPEGGETQVNTYTTDAQRDARPSIAADGSFVVVWESFTQDGDTYGVFGRAFDASATPTAQFQINEFTTAYQQDVRAAALNGGGFVVVWESDEADGDSYGVRARLLDANGQLAGSEFAINTFTTGSQGDPDVEPRPDGGFVVAWESEGPDGDNKAIVVRRFDSVGGSLGAENLVNTYVTGNQQDPAIARLDDGRFVVAWDSYGQDGSYGAVIGRLLDSDAQPIGTEFQLNAYTSQSQDDVDVAALGGGGFVVAWESYQQIGTFTAIIGRRYDSLGVALGPEFVVEDGATNYQYDPNIAREPGGGFVVVWEGDDADGYGILARRFDVQGQPRGTRFVVNTTELNEQQFNDHGHVATNVAGELVVAWGSEGIDGDGYAAMIQRFTISACEEEPQAGCLAAGKAKLQIKNLADDGKDQIKWGWIKGDAFDQTAIGAPTVDTSYTLCVYDSSGGVDTIATSLTIQASASWQDKSPKGAKYKDKVGISDGAIGGLLKPGAAGKAKVNVKAKGNAIPMPTPVAPGQYFEQDTTVTVQLVNREGTCWTSAFTTNKKNSSDKFVAKAP